MTRHCLTHAPRCKKNTVLLFLSPLCGADVVGGEDLGVKRPLLESPLLLFYFLLKS